MDARLVQPFEDRPQLRPNSIGKDPVVFPLWAVQDLGHAITLARVLPLATVP